MTSGARPGLEDRTDLIAPASAPDAMLSPAGRGKLRIYLGIAPEWEDSRDAAGRTRPPCSGTVDRRRPLGSSTRGFA